MSGLPSTMSVTGGEVGPGAGEAGGVVVSTGAAGSAAAVAAVGGRDAGVSGMVVVGDGWSRVITRGGCRDVLA